METEVGMCEEEMKAVIDRMNSENFEIGRVYRETVGHGEDYNLKVYYTISGLPVSEPQMLSRTDFEGLKEKARGLNLHGHYHFICHLENLEAALKETTRKTSFIRRLAHRVI